MPEVWWKWKSWSIRSDNLLRKIKHAVANAIGYMYVCISDVIVDMRHHCPSQALPYGMENNKGEDRAKECLQLATPWKISGYGLEP